MSIHRGPLPWTRPSRQARTRSPSQAKAEASKLEGSISHHADSASCLRVVQIDTSREWRGGQQQVLYLSKALHAAGHHSVLFTPKESPLAVRARAAGLPVQETSYLGVGDPIALRNLAQAAIEHKADLLHAHSANAHSVGFLALRLPGSFKERRPAFVVHRRVDFPPSGDPLTRMRYTAEPCLHVCVSEAVREVLASYGVPASRLRVVRSCVETSRVDAHAAEDQAALRRELDLPPDAGVIGTVGSLVPHKGHKHLLAALPRVLAARPEARVVLFGEGPLESDLRRESWRLGVQGQVLFAGFRADVARFLHALDLYAHPSVEEGLGTSILDAMAARLPVVASRAGGIPELVRHGETGWLVPPASPTELAGAIISLLEDPRRRAQFGETARQRVESEFSIPILRDRTLAVYREAIDEHTGS